MPESRIPMATATTRTRKKTTKARGEEQLVLPLSKGWGGRRENAGRKPSQKAGVSHLARPKIKKNTAAHVTWRTCREIANLRTKDRVHVVRRCLAKRCDQSGFRVVHYSIQRSHIHLVVEADSKAALALGMNALGSSIGHGLNNASGRVGRVFVDRYHSHILTTPTAARNSLCYVLLNESRHLAQRGQRIRNPRPDIFSSGPLFDGWKEARQATAPPDEGPCITKPEGWLLRTGWRLRGLISLSEIPGPREGLVPPRWQLPPDEAAR